MLRTIRKPSPAFVLAFCALLVALGGTAVALPRATQSVAQPNVKGVKASLTITNGQVGTVTAECPSGYQVFSGGYVGAGQFTHITAAAPARGARGYIVDAVEPPVNIYSSVVRETPTIHIIALCAPVNKPIVFPPGR